MGLNMTRSFAEGSEPLSGNIDAGIHIGVQGKPGPQGEDGGYYIPSVKQVSENEIILVFSPISAKMPYVEPVKIELPRGEAFTYEDFTKDQLEALKGANGFSPIVQVFPKAEVIRYPDGTMVTKEIGYTIRITDSEGYQDIDILHGEKGEKGADGKTAYEYAKDGGYTGTEEDFAQKLASDGYVVAQPEPPENTNVLWFDTDDNSEDEPDGGSAPADWDAAEGEPGHILNRTHYKTVAAIFPETSISWDAGSEMGPTVLLALSESLIVGKEYRIVWNGEEYVRTCFDFNGMAIIGDITPMDADAESTGEPFTILDGMGVQVCMPAAAWSGAEPTGTAILEIITSTVVKIPEEYIPDMQPYQVDMWSEGTSYYTLQTVYALEQAYNSGRQIVLRWAMSLDASSEMIYFFVLEQRLRQDDVVAYGFYNAELNAKIALKPNGMGGFDITRSDT